MSAARPSQPLRRPRYEFLGLKPSNSYLEHLGASPRRLEASSFTAHLLFDARGAR